MKRLYLILSVVFLLTFSVEAKKYNINVNSNKFIPDSIVINVGDTVQFTMYSTHNAQQVTKETWDKNDSTSNGGFHVPYGGGKLILNEPGKYYYVCAPHAHMGMKGIIVVSGNQTLVKSSELKGDVLLYPNPSSNFVNVSFNAASDGTSNIRLYNIAGAIVKEFSFGTTQGYNNLKLDYDNNMKPGKYLMVLDAKNNHYTKMLVIK